MYTKHLNDTKQIRLFSRDKIDNVFTFCCSFSYYSVPLDFVIILKIFTVMHMAIFKYPVIDLFPDSFIMQ